MLARALPEEQVADRYPPPTPFGCGSGASLFDGMTSYRLAQGVFSYRPFPSGVTPVTSVFSVNH
jgi:hypothetical protein